MHQLHPRPWHGGSVYGDGTRRALSFGQREQYLLLLDQAAQSRSISATAERVGRVMLALLGRDGRLDPSYETIAARTGCCERTARSAVADLMRVGLLHKVRRLVRAGWRAIQTSNAYALLLPAAPLVCASAGAIRRPSMRLLKDEIEKGCFTATVAAYAAPASPRAQRPMSAALAAVVQSFRASVRARINTR